MSLQCLWCSYNRPILVSKFFHFSHLICSGEHGVAYRRLGCDTTGSRPPPPTTLATFYNGDPQQQQQETTAPSKQDSLLVLRDSLPGTRVRPSALALSSTLSHTDEYYGDATSDFDLSRPMRNSAGTSYRDFVYQQQQQQAAASRVPPTPPGHARPFTRSSSVPEQGHYYDAYFSDLDDGLGLGAPPLSSSVDPGRYKSPSSRFQDWRTGSYAISSTLRARGQRPPSHLGRQLSVSSELPTTDPLSRYSNYNYLSERGPLSRGQLLTGPLGGLPIAPRDQDVLLHSRSPPLTLGRSLQLVTENFGRYSSAADRRKKTVRFNSEEWNRQAAALSAAGFNPASAAAYPTSLLTAGGRYLDNSCLFGGEDEDSWMSIEDVRSGRWARWDALRQESQDSQTRDSGIETGSCFTSSEDSNRGGDIYLSKKVLVLNMDWRLTQLIEETTHMTATFDSSSINQ